MALRDQPYLPLYIQDFMTDEKLIECSAETTGVYIRLMCILHKSEDYGKLLLKQKDKQTDKPMVNFALKIARQMPYSVEVVTRSINELLAENVLVIEGDFLVQKRMVKDNLLSLVRAEAGKKGGKFAQAKPKAKVKANTENEIVNENEIGNDKYIMVENEKIFDPMPVIEFYEAQLNGTQKEFGNLAWRPLVPEWFSQHIGEDFKDGMHVKNSFKKFYITKASAKNGSAQKFTPTRISLDGI